VVGVNGVSEEHVIVEEDLMLVVVIDEDLQEVIVVLNQVPVVVPFGHVKLLLEGASGVVGYQDLILQNLLSHVADLDVEDLREDHFNRALGSVVGDACVHDMD
jgi:hypothetical protein